MARSLGVSRSSLYYEPVRPWKDQQLLQEVLVVMDRYPFFGHRRVAEEMKRNPKLVLRIMRKYKLRPQVMRKRPTVTKSQQNEASEVPNLAGKLCAIYPNVIWAGDFTYLKFQNRFLYLATVIDTYTREVIGWQMGFHHTAELVFDALEHALKNRGMAPRIFHNDQGSEYLSARYLDWLKHHKIQPSHSPKGKPWNNGRQESFFSHFKLELGNIKRFSNVEKLIEAIGQHIHWYNTKRSHSSLKRMTPRAFYEKKRKAMIEAGIIAPKQH